MVRVTDSSAQFAIQITQVSLSDAIRTCVDNADVITGRTRPLLMTVNEQVIPDAVTA